MTGSSGSWMSLGSGAFHSAGGGGGGSGRQPAVGRSKHEFALGGGVAGNGDKSVVSPSGGVMSAGGVASAGASASAGADPSPGTIPTGISHCRICTEGLGGASARYCPGFHRARHGEK